MTRLLSIREPLAWLAALLMVAPLAAEDRRAGEVRVVNRPWITEVRILGAGRMSLRRLKRVVEPYEYSRMNPRLLNDCKHDVLDLYRDHGFDRAAVECELSLDDKNRWRLDVLIVEGL
ncbi:MAG: hypothetical protein SFU86_05010 [Pirellulaceae bacterium]|nr:hypothetical protein [Pirellulaceae bacterium]